MATHTVQNGESLSLISQKYFGDFSMTEAIAKINSITNKDVIYPGMVLELPLADGNNVEKSPVKMNHTVIVGGLMLAAVLAYLAYKSTKKKKVKAAFSGTKGKTIIGKTKAGKVIYVGKNAEDYTGFTKQDHMDASDAHYKHYHKKGADGSTVSHGKRSLESHLKAAEHGDYKK